MSESKKFTAYIDTDKSLGLETNTIFKNFFNVFFIPILNSLPKNFKNTIKKTNNSAAVVIDNVTTHKALEVLYSKGELFSVNKFLTNIFKKVWFNVNNSKAVRNRLRLVKKELNNFLKERIKEEDKNIKVISIASGSSRAIIEVVKSENYHVGTNLSLTFLDKSEHAINYSKKLSTEISHLPISLNWVQDTVGSYLDKNKDLNNKFDVVEIVGLLDYFDDEKITKIFSGIYQILDDGGIVITSNINHNSEEKFLTKVIDWPMVYRTAEELATLVNVAGFKFENIRPFYEPLKVHGLVVAKK